MKQRTSSLSDSSSLSLWLVVCPVRGEESRCLCPLNKSLGVQSCWSVAGKVCVSKQQSSSCWGELTMCGGKNLSHFFQINKATEELNMHISLYLAVHREAHFLLSKRQLSQTHVTNVVKGLRRLWCFDIGRIIFSYSNMIVFCSFSCFCLTRNSMMKYCFPAGHVGGQLVADVCVQCTPEKEARESLTTLFFYG